jgi:ABC-2 type transport system ATP-binding protein
MMTTLTSHQRHRPVPPRRCREPDGAPPRWLIGRVATVDEPLTGRENIRMIGGPRHPGAILPGTNAGTVSSPTRPTGWSSRTGVARAVGSTAVSLPAPPPVLFLDEPTTGSGSPQPQRPRDALRGLVEQGTTPG